MSDFPWANLDSPEIVCATFTDYDEADATRFRLAKLVKASGKTKQYGVFVDEYGNVYRVVVRDRVAAAKVRAVSKQKRQPRQQRRV